MLGESKICKCGTYYDDYCHYCNPERYWKDRLELETRRLEDQTRIVLDIKRYINEKWPKNEQSRNL